MKKISKKNKRIFKRIFTELSRLSFIVFFAFLAVVAVCFVLSLPEILASLIL